MAAIEGRGSRWTGKAKPDRLAYRPAELAAMVGLSAKAIYRAVERGELAAARVANGTRLLIPAESAESWLMSNSVAPRPTHRPPGARKRGGHGQPLGTALRRLSEPPADE